MVGESMTEKLDHELDQVKIKQTSTKNENLEPIRFRDEAINKIKKANINFGKRSYIFVPFIVSKDSHQKGLKLRVFKGSVKEKIHEEFSMFNIGLMVSQENLNLERIVKTLV